jgi:hypothetical protein
MSYHHSLGLCTTDQDNQCDNTGDEKFTSSASKPAPKPRKRKLGEMKEYFEE